jgi:hypothetical protein
MEVDIDPHTNPVGTTLYWSPEMVNIKLKVCVEIY